MGKASILQRTLPSLAPVYLSVWPAPLAECSTTFTDYVHLGMQGVWGDSSAAVHHPFV
jgi:hypothetical protein